MTAARPSTTTDPLIRQLREEISDSDRALVDAMNKRLQLVARLKSYKESRGLEFVDLQRANRGPLTPEGLRELFAEVLDLTKREVARGEEA